MDDNKAIDVEYEDIGNIMYITAPQMAQKINDTEIRVRYWGDSFGELIGLEKKNGRKKFKETDIYKFTFIKELIDKNFTHEQVKEYISKHGCKYAEFNSGLVNIKDPLGFQALATALSIEMNSKLELHFENDRKNRAEEQRILLINQQNIIYETKAEIEASIDKLVSEKLATHIEQFKSIIDNQELEATKRYTEMSDLVKMNMEQKQEENAKEENEKKGFFKRVFGK